MNYVLAMLTGLVVCIPLALKLVEYVRKAVQEKNWAALLSLVMHLMEVAEKQYTNGATRKRWVMSMVMASSEYVNYPINEAALSELIDRLCDMTKHVNFDVTAVKA